VKKKILQLLKKQNSNPPISYLVYLFQCMVGVKACWLVLLSLTSVAIKSNFKLPSTGRSHKNQQAPKVSVEKCFDKKYADTGSISSAKNMKQRQTSA